MDNGCFGEGMLLVAECLPDADLPLAAVWHTYSVANTKGAMQRCVFPMSTGTKCMLTVLSKTGAGNRICNSVTSWATIHYLVCLKVTSSFETQGKKESWIKDPYSVYRNTTPTNNVVARGAAWERLAMASFNDYELKLKKKNHWELENTFHWFIPDFPGRTDKKKMKNGRKIWLVQQETFYMALEHTHTLTLLVQYLVYRCAGIQLQTQ